MTAIGFLLLVLSRGALWIIDEVGFEKTPTAVMIVIGLGFFWGGCMFVAGAAIWLSKVMP